MNAFTILLILICIMCSSLASAKDQTINMQGLSIIGNKELPNILYILPWKSADLPEMVELPLSSLINNALQVIDRKTILRQQQYRKIIQYKNLSPSKVQKK